MAPSDMYLSFLSFSSSFLVSDIIKTFPNDLRKDKHWLDSDWAQDIMTVNSPDISTNIPLCVMTH
jgi:hypothetical protein